MGTSLGFVSPAKDLGLSDCSLNISHVRRYSFYDYFLQDIGHGPLIPLPGSAISILAGATVFRGMVTRTFVPANTQIMLIR